MLTISGPAKALCAGVSRRGFLKIGGLGLGGLSLPSAPPAARAAEGTKTSVILFWMAGGPSHIDTYDMKPEAPEVVRGPFKPIATTLPGFEVCELLPKHADIARHCSVIRSITHDLSVHDDGQHWVQTGYPLLNARQRGQQHPCQGSVVAKEIGPHRPGMPAYVCIPEDYQRHAGFYQSAAFLGRRYDAVNGGGDPALGNYRLPDFALGKDVTLARLQSRQALVPQLDGLRNEVERTNVLAASDTLHQKAFDLVTGATARDAFDLAQEAPTLRERYGRHAYGQSALLARRLVEAGVTFVTINLYEKDVDWWDDHTTIEKNLRKRLPQYDDAVATLIADLDERGLLDSTLVVACGEFGRSPKIDSGAGRGHWPRAMSVLLAGGGVRPGQIVGRTTRDGGEPADRALGPGDLLATIYQKLGISPDLMLNDHQGRPVRVIDSGRPIEELC